MMIHSKRLRLWLYLVLLAVFISACGMKEEKQIKESFNKTLSLYPTKTLKTFMIKKALEIKNLKRVIKVLGLLIPRW